MKSPANGPTAGIAWIAGRWGSPTELSLPLQDRGLRLADGLFETVLVQAGQPVLLEAHLRRWRASAALLAMAPPPSEQQLEPLIQAAIQRTNLDGPACGALRLNWSRGDGSGRGIDLPSASSSESRDATGHRFWLQLTPTTPAFEPQTACISRHERRNGASRLSRCKTFAYGQAVQARREAHEAGADEALLLGVGGDLCCGAVANLLVWRRGRWLTPPLNSGCLPGVMRARALELGLAEEAELPWSGQADALAPSEERWLLLNSLGCRPVSAVNGQPIQHLSAAEAEALWRQLL